MKDLQISVLDAIKRLEKDYSDLPSSKFNQAVSTSLNKIAAQAKTASAKQIRSVYPRIKARDIKQTISVGKSNAKTLIARLTTTGARQPIIDFQSGAWKGRNGKGVYVNIKGQRKLFPHAFIATMRSGHQGVFIRSQAGGVYEGGHLKGRTKRINPWGKNDLAIGEIKTLAVPRAAHNPAVIAAMESLTRDKFPGILLHELQRKAGMIAGART